MRDMNKRSLDLVGPERAAHAALLPSGAKHEMIDNQLAASTEEICERLLAVGAVEHVVLLDLNPWQLAQLPAQFIVGPGKFLFFRQMRLACGDPLFAGHGWMVHGSVSSGLRFLSFALVLVQGRQIFREALDRAGPAIAMVVAGLDRFKGLLTQRQPGLAAQIGEGNRDQRFVAERAVRIFVRPGEGQPLRLEDFTETASDPMLNAVRRDHADAPTTTGLRIKRVRRHRETARPKPSQQVLRFYPGAEDEGSRRIEDALDDQRPVS